jgi:hypothetical protein
MTRDRHHEQQTSRDVHRAEVLVSRVRGMSVDESAGALRRHASACGVSLHAAALSVLATSPTDELLTSSPRS